MMQWTSDGVSRQWLTDKHPLNVASLLGSAADTPSLSDLVESSDHHTYLDKSYLTLTMSYILLSQTKENSLAISEKNHNR